MRKAHPVTLKVAAGFSLRLIRWRNLKVAATILLLFPLFSSRGYGQTIPFAPGESFQYLLKWNFLAAGKMSFSIVDDVYIDGERAFHLQGDTETEGIGKKFYPFKAKMESFISQKDFLPLRYQLSSSAPNETMLELVNYPRGQLRGYWHEEKCKRGKEKSNKEENFAVPAFFQDPFSVLYYLRTQEFKVGDRIGVPVSSARNEYRIMVKVLRKTKIRVMGKTWDSFLLETGASLQGVPFQKGSLWVWFSADEARIPLYFSARAPLGVVSATLVKMKTIK